MLSKMQLLLLLFFHKMRGTLSMRMFLLASENQFLFQAWIF